MAYPDTAPGRSEVEEELEGFSLSARRPYIDAMIAAVSGEMGARLRGLGLHNGDISIVDRQTQAWVHRLILIESSRRVLVALSDAEATPDAERRIESYRDEFSTGVALLNDLPSDFFSTLPVIKTIVGDQDGYAPAGSAVAAPTAGGLTEQDIIALIDRGVAQATISRDMLADDVGFPSYYVATVAYDDTTGVLSGDIGVGVDLEPPAILFFEVPDTFPRSRLGLTLDVGGHRNMLHTLTGERVIASDLIPRQLAEALVRFGAYRLVEPLLPRPQDFVIHYFLFEADNALQGVSDSVQTVHALTQAVVDGATYHTMSTATSARVNLPTNYVPSHTYAEAYAVQQEDYDTYLGLVSYLAVPDVAPDIRGYSHVFRESRGFAGTIDTSISHAARVSDRFNIGGVPHKFLRILDVVSPDFEAADPPNDWEPWNDHNAYYVIGFEGLPDPPPIVP